MKLTNFMQKACIPAAILLSFATASAQVIDTVSINWKEFSGGVNDVLDGYGVEPANNWQNLQQISSGTDVITSSGAASTVDFNVTAAGGFDTWGFAAQNNTPMRAGISVFAIPATIDLTGLSSTFSSYDIIVYTAGFNAAAGGNVGEITDGTSTFYYTVPNPYTTSLIESTDTSNGDGADQGTFVRFSGLTADATTLTLTAINGGLGIGGIQITGAVVPEPSTFAFIGGLLALGLVIRRRLK